ncbi:MAG: SDR family NAD(P)-dependent oxidoreductase [Candidatus Brocadiia bacterium]
MNRFENKVAVVTGSSSGIGKGVALRLAREGADICVVANRNVDGGKATRDEVGALGRRAVFVRADVSDAEDCRRIVETARADLGPVDLLVNNAGITRGRPLEELDEQLWDTVLDTNLKSAYMLSRLAAPDMLDRGRGAVVNVSSVHAEQTHGPYAAYAASKAGLCGMSRAMALELGPRGVRVNCILPGTIDTSLYGRKNPPADRAAWRPRSSDAQVFGRMGSPDEIAAAVAFLLSEDASFINGAALVADGGLLCKLGDEFG